MKTSVSILLVLAFNSCLAQCKLGFTEQQIRAYYPSISFEEGHTKVDNAKYINCDVDGALFTTYFDAFGLSQFCMIVPKTNDFLNNLVQQYNKDYVIISNTEWRSYSSGGIMRVELLWSDKNVPYFWYGIISNNSN